MPNPIRLSLKFTSTLILLSIGSSTAALASTPPPVPPQLVNPAPSRPLPTYVTTVIQAGGYDGPAIGYAAVKSPLYAAFEQTLATGKKLYPQLQAVYPTATPAGKLYIARVIQSVNPIEGQLLLLQLAIDSTPITEANGCTISSTTVGAIAQELLR